MRIHIPFRDRHFFWSGRRFKWGYYWPFSQEKPPPEGEPLEFVFNTVVIARAVAGKTYFVKHCDCEKCFIRCEGWRSRFVAESFYAVAPKPAAQLELPLPDTSSLPPSRRLK